MFFLFLVFNNFFIIRVVKEDIKLILALTIPTGAPITLVKEMMYIHHLLQIRHFKSFSDFV